MAAIFTAIRKQIEKPLVEKLVEDFELDEEEVAAAISEILDGILKGGKGKRAPTLNEAGEVVKRKSGYNLFSMDVRPKIAKDSPKLAKSEYMSEIGARWAKLTDKQKEAWNTKAAKMNEENGITTKGKVAAKPAAEGCW
jgi:hypothetical protein